MNYPRVRKIKNFPQVKVYKSDPHPDMYLDHRNKRFIMMKTVNEKNALLIRRFCDVEIEEDYNTLIYDWNVQLAEMGDLKAQDWLEVERSNSSLIFTTPEEEDYYNSPRESTYFAWKNSLKKKSLIENKMKEER